MNDEVHKFVSENHQDSRNIYYKRIRMIIVNFKVNAGLLRLAYEVYELILRHKTNMPHLFPTELGED